MAHGLLYGASCSNGVLTFVDKAGRIICSATLKKYLTFTATQNGSSVALQKEGSGTLDNHYKYSVNGGAWQDYTLTNPGVAIPLDAGDYVEWRCTERNTMQSTSNYVHFIMTGRIEASNPITSIVYDKMSYDDIDPIATTANTSYACYKLFLGCTALTKAPELPATNLRPNCYNTLFSGCTNLTVAPVLPATTVYSKAYSYMFQSTGITSAPSLPATNVQELAYKGMFYNCPNLVTPPPELPATSTGANAYNQMFLGCSALTKSPVISVLSARSGSSSSGDLGSMFYGCLALNEIKCALSTVPAGDTNYAKSWTFNVAQTGDFYGDPTFPWASGVDGIPIGWEVWVLGAEDTGNTTSMYYRGTQTTVMVGTSEYGTCYSIQGWVGFKSLAEMHDKGYTIDAQTSVTIYKDDYAMTAYTCAAGGSDGFTELMYDACDGKGYRTSAQLLADGYAFHQQPLTLKATADNSSVKLTINGTTTNAYDVDTGNGWEAYTFDTVINLNNGDTCKWRCSSHPDAQDSTNYVQFVMTGTIEASGSINSMLTPSFDGLSSLVGYDNAFYQLFKSCTALQTPPAIPALVLSYQCYRSLFDSTSLSVLPKFPATTLAEGCYRSMFYNDRSISGVVELPALTTEKDCYRSMFYGGRNISEVHIAASGTLATGSTYQWLYSVSQQGDFYFDPSVNYPSGATGCPSNWNRWVYGAIDTGTITTMYKNGSAVSVIVGSSPYGICYSVSGWNGFKDLEGMHAQGYSLQEPTEVQMYHRGIEVTVYKLSANGVDGFTENMYNVNNKFLTLSSMHNAVYSYGVQTGITVYSMYEVPYSGVSCPANEDDGFTETMYAVDEGYSLWTTFLTLTDMENREYFLSINDIPLVLKSLSTSTQVALELYNTSSTSFLNTFEYRFSSSNQWSEISLGTPITMSQTMLIRMKSKGTEQDTNRYVRFVISGTNTDVQAYGNLNAMCSTTYKTLTRVPDHGLRGLFSSCSQLTRAPRLPATSVGVGAYASLFSGTGILEAPELPAMSLSSSCYYSMFYGTRITKSPLLPALTLANDCYHNLFENCTSLTEVRMAATNVSANGCLVYWLKHVASSGTLYVSPNIILPQPSPSGVPSGWTRRDIADYPTT